MSGVICIYHSNCSDGFSAAWVVRKALGKDVEFFPGVYQMPPPDVKGKKVVVVDFSYKRPAMEKIIADAAQVIHIDHHKTAIEDLESIPESDKFVKYYDLNNSGAMLTWKYFFPTEKPPRLLEYVEDRDLWKFSLPNTREVIAGLFSYEYTFENWDRLMNNSISPLMSDGAAIERKHFKDIRELINVLKKPLVVAGYKVNAVNLPYTMSSDAGHILCEQGELFGCCYYDKKEGREFSLRSEGDFDVSEIAKKYGGGGHKNAAGFRVSREDARLMEEF
jgi:oligoribonuclease NrnB/cAMP/cGMP phosphodiesterase (DHH superfamily)